MEDKGRAESDSARSITYERLWKSHLVLRGLLGILGLALPVVLLIWGHALAGPFDPPLDSISDYYHYPGMGHFFVGTLMAIGSFLAAYQGYDRIDNLAGWLAGVFAFGVAFCPNLPHGTVHSVLHFVFAGGLFLVLSFFSIFLFTKKKPKEDLTWPRRIAGILSSTFRKKTPKRDQRNVVYVVCGVVMLGLMAFYALLRLALTFREESALLINLDESTILFWIEALMLWAFGVSWIVKGQWLWLLNDTKKESDRESSEQNN
jgi:hypothetical protein